MCGRQTNIVINKKGHVYISKRNSHFNLVPDVTQRWTWRSSRKVIMPASKLYIPNTTLTIEKRCSPNSFEQIKNGIVSGRLACTYIKKS